MGLGRGLGLPDRSCQKVLFCFRPWFLPVVSASNVAVKKSRSAKARAGRQMGRWADRCRGIGHQLPTASDGPQAGRWRWHSSTSRLLDFSTGISAEQSENVYENKRQGQKVGCRADRLLNACRRGELTQPFGDAPDVPRERQLGSSLEYGNQLLKLRAGGCAG